MKNDSAGEKVAMVMPEVLEPDNVLAVVRYRGEIQYRLSDRENWILDWNRRRQEYATAGHPVLELRAMAQQRAGVAILDQDTVELFLNAPGVHRIDPGFLRKSLLERFDSAQSWWDVEFLFPIAFVDFDNRRFAGFYQDGPRLERYVPDDWKGEFSDFANTFPEELYPSAAKFWIVDGRDLLLELIERGRDG
ncbi:group-specific protein [Pseudoduganella armeniaca]|nr:group-specific protein [Pseudoduganella armeniaca]